MKKLFLISLTLIGFIFSANAQRVSDNALGLRMGDSDAFGAEISYQRALNEGNRLEFDLGWRDGTANGNDFDGFKITGLYQWVNHLDGNFNWYYGVGGGLGSYDFGILGDDTFIFAAGNIGLEYDFEIPLLISLDARPEIGFGDKDFENNNLIFDIALGVRYQF